jgi:FG-GAP-like repeat
MYPKCLFYAVFLGTLSAQPPSFDLTTIPTKNTPQSLIVGDFNRDGRPDLAVSGIDAGGNGTVEILLGNGDGSFRSAGVITVGAHASRIAQADFNSDGKLDLAVSVGDSGQVVVLLGNGDGSFKGPVDSGARVPAGQLGATVPGLAVGDINGDGKPDLVLGPYTFTASCSLAVLLGNGDGTFRSPVNSPMDRVDRPQALVADLNGDGRADVFVTGWSPDKGNQRFGRLLGNGDGSLTLTWSTYTYPFIFGTLITIHDVNGNGKPDVIGIDYLDYPNAGRLPLATFLDGSLEEIFSSVDVPNDSRAGLTYQSMTAAENMR